MRKKTYKGRLLLSLVLSAFFFVLIQFQAGMADAEISLDDIAEQRVLFGAISGDYEVFYDIGYEWVTRSYDYCGPILWRAATTDIITEDSEEGTVTLLSEYLLGGRVQYDTDESRGGPDSGIAQFNGSKVQKWLNETKSLGFLEYFDAQERAAIPELMIPESKNRAPGGATDFVSGVSKVFILNQGGPEEESELELDRFNQSFKSGPIVDEEEQQKYRIGNDLGFQVPIRYWTRSCGHSMSGAGIVSANGLYVNGYHVRSNYVGVRPALKINLQSVIFKSLIKDSDLEKLLGFAPQDAAAAEGGSPSISGAYMLYCTSADVPVASVDISVSGNELTISFDQPVAHAYTDTASADALAAKFTVSDGQGEDVTVSGLEFKNGKLVLMLEEEAAPGDGSYSVAYKPYADTDTDGIGFPATRTVMKSLISNKTQPGSISVMVDGKTYTAQQQLDGTYLILLSSDTEASVLSSLELKVKLPDGATISPDIETNIDFSEGVVTFTITAADKTTTQDIIIEVRISVAQTAEGKAVTTDASQCHVYVTYNADGTLSVEIRLPFVDGFDPLTLDSLSAALSGLENLSFTYEDGEGGAYLRIMGTALDLAALESAELSCLTYWLEEITTKYWQDFKPALKIADMLITYTNAPSGSSSNSNCNSGVGAAFFALAGLFFVGKRKR